VKDDDLFVVNVPAGLAILVNLTFGAEQNLNLELLSPDGTVIDFSRSTMSIVESVGPFLINQYYTGIYNSTDVYIRVYMDENLTSSYLLSITVGPVEFFITRPTINTPSDVSYPEGETGYNITWVPSDTDPKSYNITRDGVLVKEGYWNNSEETITISVVGLGVGTYIYCCSVVDYEEQIAYDEVTVYVTEIQKFPLPPQNLHATTSDKQIYLDWEIPLDNGSSNIKEYRIYRYYYTYNYTYIGSTSSLEFIDNTINKGITYYYVITAVNGEGESEFSNEVSIISVEGTSEIESTIQYTSTSSTETSEPRITNGFSSILIVIPFIVIIINRRKRFSLKV